MQSGFYSLPVIGSMLGFLVVYAVGIVLLFRREKWGVRRKWHPLDYIWVPLGAATGVCLLALVWRAYLTK